MVQYTQDTEPLLNKQLRTAPISGGSSRLARHVGGMGAKLRATATRPPNTYYQSLLPKPRV